MYDTSNITMVLQCCGGMKRLRGFETLSHCLAVGSGTCANARAWNYQLLDGDFSGFIAQNTSPHEVDLGSMVKHAIQ